MSRTQWKSEDVGGYVEVTPVHDNKQHYAGDECWCNPKTEYIEGKAMIVHHLYDNCKSYNWSVGELPEVILQRPDWLYDGERVNGVPVDYCLAPTVLHLWQNGIETLGSCCGHGREEPSLILKAKHADDAKTIFDLIAETDSRNFALSWWQNEKRITITAEDV
jgi:hypothetical protein